MNGSLPYDLQAFVNAGMPAIDGWPIGRGASLSINAAMFDDLAQMLQDSSGEQRRILQFAAPYVHSAALAIAVALLTLHQAREHGQPLTFAQSDSVAAIVNDHGRLAENPVLSHVLTKFQLFLKPPSHRAARTLALAGLMNRNPALWGGRKISVLNRNHLLWTTAQASRGIFWPTFSDALLAAGPQPLSASQQSACTALAETLTLSLRNALEANGLPASAFAAVFTDYRQQIDDFLQAIAGWWGGVQKGWKPPAELWSGSGGALVNRFARAAVQDAGGRTVGFDHGGGAHVHARPISLRLIEFMFTSAFVTDTEAKAAVYRRTVHQCQDFPDTIPEFLVTPSKGYNGFALTAPPPPVAGDHRTVMYVTTIFFGERQLSYLLFMPDVIHADWQRRLLTSMTEAGHTVMCKQHPEGLLRGKPLITCPQASYPTDRFLTVAPQADVFVFDFPSTTTLWEAICTGKPVVFIDLGLIEWEPSVWADFTRRVRVVPGGFDEHNRPWFDQQAFHEALRAPALTDDTFARRYLTGA